MHGYPITRLPDPINLLPDPTRTRHFEKFHYPTRPDTQSTTRRVPAGRRKGGKLKFDQSNFNNFSKNRHFLGTSQSLQSNIQFLYFSDWKIVNFWVPGVPTIRPDYPTRKPTTRNYPKLDLVVTSYPSSTRYPKLLGSVDSIPEILLLNHTLVLPCLGFAPSRSITFRSIFKRCPIRQTYCLNIITKCQRPWQFYDCKLLISYRIITLIVLVLSQIYEVWTWYRFSSTNFFNFSDIFI